MEKNRPVALITGASRAAGIGAAIAEALARAGWDVALTYWRPYDAAMPWGSAPEEVEALCERLRALGARVCALEADLADAEAPARLFDAIEQEFGGVTALVLSHCHDIESDLLTTTVESFDRHFAINARASWLLVREFGLRFSGPTGAGRIVALTSDHTAGNLPYGASKGALDRIVLAAAKELGAARHFTANVVNPGATDTGWMTPAQLAAFGQAVPLGRVGLSQDAARLVAFLCSPEGGWINGQLLHSDGGVG